MPSLFPEIDTDRTDWEGLRRAWAAYRRKWGRNPPPGMVRGAQSPEEYQRILLSGLDCLEGQQELFATDGPPDMTEESGARLGRLGPECLSPGDSGEGRARPLFGSENG
jgi:hypothetical protein